MDSDSESDLFTHISRLLLGVARMKSRSESKLIPLVVRIISFLRSKDLDSLPKPESKLMSLVSQAISLFNSTDLDSLPKPLSKLISFISQKVCAYDLYLSSSFCTYERTLELDPADPRLLSLVYSDSDKKPESDLKFLSLVEETLDLKPYPELISLIFLIFYVVISTNTQLKELTLLGQLKEFFYDGKQLVTPGGLWDLESALPSLISNLFSLRDRDTTDPEWQSEIMSLIIQIITLIKSKPESKLQPLFIQIISFARSMDMGSQPMPESKPESKLMSGLWYSDLYIPPPKWHDHTLAFFPRRAFLTCNICALADSSSPIYMCPPCDFVVHLKCINLPRVIRISRHPHHLHHIPSFEEGNLSCNVCRKKIDNNYGSYSCVRYGCSYAAHARCATQISIWDGIDLDGVPEEIEEEVADPFVMLSYGIMQHFSHDHHLRPDENPWRDYDDNKLCQACVTPIYSCEFYSCVQCEFVLHEICAHLSLKIYVPIHPHQVTLSIVRDVTGLATCAACDRSFPTAGFFYECRKEECHFWLHVHCATISEPLVHQSHVHQLFLTSPEEKRKCSVCRRGGFRDSMETFNCIEECDDFALCFRCATLPQRLRYKHDNHILTLSYGEETDTVTYWCEACEGKINPKEGFYMCDEYCCVTIHIGCLIGRDLYMKPGSSFFYAGRQVGVQSNNHHMSRPICNKCKKRCAQKIRFQLDKSICCSLGCLLSFCIK